MGNGRLLRQMKKLPSVEQMAPFVCVVQTLMEQRLNGLDIQPSHLLIKL